MDHSVEEPTKNRPENPSPADLYLKINPSVFISPPFVECPKCRQKTFGVLSVSDHQYARRCKACLYPKGNERGGIFPLPEITKKVIYLDQFAISNMMKALNTETPANRKGQLDPFWLDLFSRIDVLCKLQLLVCPDSMFHEHESLASPFYRELKRMYGLLSGGATFKSWENILQIQVLRHAKNWLAGEELKDFPLDRASAFYKDINVWTDRIRVSTNIRYPPEWFEEYRRERELAFEGLKEIFEAWQTEGDREFKDWFAEEVAGYGRSIIRCFLEQLTHMREVSAGARSLDLDYIFPHTHVILFYNISEMLKKRGFKIPEALSKTIEYLASPSLKVIPSIKISSMLYAALARRAAKQKRKNPPNRGMRNDMRMISAYLPYCDAMFIDKECHSLLSESPLKEEICYGTRLFSLRNKSDFLDYLDSIERDASKEHLEKVKEVYGEDWARPYTSLYGGSVPPS